MALMRKITHILVTTLSIKIVVNPFYSNSEILFRGYYGLYGIHFREFYNNRNIFEKDHSQKRKMSTD